MRRLSAVLAILVLAAAGEARADLAKATAHYERGTRLYQVGEYAKAIEEFKAGFLEDADPSFLYNVAQCHRQLGQAKEAVVSYRRFLTLSPDTPLRAEVERKIREAEERLRRPRTQPAAARPAPEAAVAHLRPPARTETPPSAGPSRWPLWVGGAATVAAAGGAIALGLTTNQRFEELRDTCGKQPAGCPASEISAIRNRGTVINVLWFVAGASAVATGIAFYATSREAGVSVAGRF